jgi:2,5-diamino-6-(ribosylamino)-4(3H)-pyrimidinone 5'-phosphate reductase
MIDQKETSPTFSRPRILVNVAMSVDGKLDLVSRKGATISSAADKMRVDNLRADVDAVMVGGRTLLQENPRLTVRSEGMRSGRMKLGKPENPIKVGVVTRIGEADLPSQSDFLSAGPAAVILFTTTQTAPETIRRLEASRAQVYIMGDERVDLLRVMEGLFQAGIQTLLVEGGGTLLAELFRLDVVDELTIYMAPRIFGGAGAPTLADGAGFDAETAPRCKLVHVGRLDEDGGILLKYEILHKE